MTDTAIRLPLKPIIARHAARMSGQLVDSTLETTRVYWRERAGATPAEARDPRPFAVVVAERTASNG